MVSQRDTKLINRRKKQDWLGCQRDNVNNWQFQPIACYVYFVRLYVESIGGAVLFVGKESQQDLLFFPILETALVDHPRQESEYSVNTERVTFALVGVADKCKTTLGVM